MFKRGLFVLNSNINNFISLRHVSNHVKDHTERQIQKQILQRHLGISYQKSAALFRKHVYLKSIDSKKLDDTLNSLTKMGIDLADVYEFPMTLTLHSNTVEHNVKYLQEAGFTHISAPILLKFRTTVKKPITLLKVHGVIPEDVNVPKRLYSYLFPKPDKFPVLQKFTEEDSIIHIHETIFRHYLEWRLETTMGEIERVFKIYDKFKYKSFDLISRMIGILTTDLKFTNQKLLQHAYLFQNGPEYISQILESFPTLAGVDSKIILFKYPKIIAASPENITAINTYLKKFGIKDEAIRKCYDIYTLAPDTVLYRLNELKTIPELQVLVKNTRIVQLMLCQNKAKLRLEHLKKLNLKCVSINMLCVPDAKFEKYAQEGNDRTKGFDVISYICQELNIPHQNCRRQLSDNPHWCHVPLISIQNTLKYLLDNEIPKSAIGHLAIILLYPKNQVRDALREIDNNPELFQLNLNFKERLNVCLYFLEKKHHFSGDGIWDNSSLEVAANVN